MEHIIGWRPVWITMERLRILIVQWKRYPMSDIDFCWHFLPDIEKFNLEFLVIKMTKWFNACWIETAQFFCSLSHAELAGRIAVGPLFSGVRIAWGYTVKWQWCLKKELKRKKKNRNHLGVKTWRRKEWVRQRESVKGLRWCLEAWWHLQPFKAPPQNAVINCRSHRWNAEKKEQEQNTRKSLISHPFCPVACDLPREIGIRCGSQPDFKSTRCSLAGRTPTLSLPESLEWHWSVEKAFQSADYSCVCQDVFETERWVFSCQGDLLQRAKWN